ncbi:MAG: hypothetical protein OT477_13175 [Chloroflexi bacterium]|nr:hypothetical protein [Chloroflexota bacterium]
MFSPKRFEPIVMIAKGDGTVEYRPLVAEETSVGQLLMDIFLPRAGYEPPAAPSQKREWRPFFLPSLAK